MMTKGYEEVDMSRSNSQRGNRGRSWNDRNDFAKKDYSSKSSRKEHSINRERENFHNDRNDRDRSKRNDKRGYDARSSARGVERRTDRRGQLLNNIVSQKEIQEQENAIKAFREKIPVCEICGQPITDIASAISNKDDGNPVHFDCVLNKLTELEKPGANEKIAYIGQGRFAVIYFENPRDTKHFSIRKTIEWEGRDQEREAWRNKMASLYSQVK